MATGKARAVAVDRRGVVAMTPFGRLGSFLSHFLASILALTRSSMETFTFKDGSASASSHAALGRARGGPPDAGEEANGVADRYGWLRELAPDNGMDPDTLVRNYRALEQQRYEYYGKLERRDKKEGRRGTEKQDWA